MILAPEEQTQLANDYLPNWWRALRDPPEDGEDLEEDEEDEEPNPPTSTL